MKKTHIEIRNESIERELFTLTDEMMLAMEEARKRELAKFPEEKIGIDDNNNNFRPYDQGQNFFIAITNEKFLASDHPAVIIDAIIEKLDLSNIYDYYSNEGNPPYHPKMMLKILFYAYYISKRSCRFIWDAVINRADFIYLAAGQVPNFRTINDFRLRHLTELPDLFTQILLMCKKLGLIGFDHLSIDGEKIEANASFKKSKNIEGLRKEYKKTKEGLEKILNKEVNEYFTEEKQTKRVKKLEKKLKQLKSFQKKLEKFGDEKTRINMTDPDAKTMTHKDGTKTPSYNHQTARDGLYGIVTGYLTKDNVDKPEDLPVIVEQSKQNCNKSHDKITADSAFCSYKILEEIEEREENFFIPDKRFVSSEKKLTKSGIYSCERFKKAEDGSYKCPQGYMMKEVQRIEYEDGHSVTVHEGTGCTDCPKKSKCTKGKKRKIAIDSRIIFRDKMREKLKTDEGREIYMKRLNVSESVHGDDQKNKGWIQHHLRSFKKASMEFVLMRIITNLGIMFKHRSKEILAWE